MKLDGDDELTDTLGTVAHEAPTYAVTASAACSDAADVCA